MSQRAQRSTSARVAAALWIVWAVLLWNVVFDHVIVVAGREYIVAASLAARAPGPYARLDDWMRPAVGRAVAIATTSAGAVLLVGLVAVRLATRSTGAPDQQVSS